jgi:curli biogenesis system outer membrane secretion channel CsgG
MDQREMAVLGGKARWKGIGKRKRSQIAKAAIDARWAKERAKKAGKAKNGSPK